MSIPGEGKINKSRKLIVEEQLKDFPNMFKGVIPKNIIKQVYEEYIKQHQNDQYSIISTDASLKVETGCAVYDQTTEISLKYKIQETISSTLADLTAIDKAITYCDHQRYEKIALFTDSRPSCQIEC